MSAIMRQKTTDELHYIIRDAGAALKCIESLGEPKHPSLGKYADQINDAITEVHRRSLVSRPAREETWISRDGLETKVADMSSCHVRNALRKLIRLRREAHENSLSMEDFKSVFKNEVYGGEQ
jgi:hypothetical protein